MSSALRLLLSAAAIVWLNAYIGRDLFHSGFTGYTNSMQGFWAGLARLAGHGHWIAPHWWRWHDAGAPFEWTYQPLIPGLAALWSHLFGVEPIRGVQAVTGLVYCLGPAALFLFCAVATRRIGWSFATAVAYSLLAPVDWAIPDSPPALASIVNTRRLYLMAVWDETPHYGALLWLPLALLCAAEGIRTGRWRWWAGATAAMSLSLMTSAFGATTLAIGVLCLAVAFRRWTSLAWIVGAAAVAWALAAPSLPPSLIHTIRANAVLHGDSGWDFGGLTALSVVIAGAVAILLVCERRRAGWWPRFVCLFAWVVFAIPFLFQYAERHFIPQPGRYKVEAELGLILAGALALQSVFDRLPVRMRLALALVGLSLAAETTIRHRRYEKHELVREKNPDATLEYKVASWTSAHLANARVALPGSLALWFNAFADGQQFSGGSYPTAFNPVQQRAWNLWLSASTPEQAAESVLWLKAFGTYAFAVPGRESGEFWKALNHPELFLPCEAMWHQSDTTVCRVPGATESLAHAVPATAVVSGAADIDKIRRYTAALDSGRHAEFRWQGSSSALIRAPALLPGEALSVQINFHPGWSATASGGQPVSVRSDGLGLTVVESRCDGPCEIRLEYTGGTELLLCHILRWTTVIGLGALALSRRRSRGMATRTGSDIR